MSETFVYDCTCDYPGCGEPAPHRIDLILWLRQNWIGGKVSMNVHIFSCDEHRLSVQRFSNLLLESKF